jgi:hypothetical protein
MQIIKHMKKRIIIFTLAEFLGLVVASSVSSSSQGRAILKMLGLGRLDCEMVNTSKYKEKPPYVVGFSNVSVSNSWSVQFV